MTRSPVSPRSPAVLDVARLRRLRGMPFSRDIFGPRVYEAAELARFLYGIAETPLHLVPSRPDDWGRFFRQGLPLLESRWFRLIPPDLAFRGIPRDWDLAAWALRVDPDHDADAPICHADGIADMVDRAARDLGPAILDLGSPPDRHPRLARHLLLAGRGYLESWRLSHRWHLDLAPFDALLEYGIEATWPAWFAPFEGPGGTRIACLVDGRSLADEGGRRPDASGVPGLDHCVGGYVRDCRTGRRCVASITGPGPDGGRIRLSTVEFSPVGGRLEVEQHLGYRNGEPPDAAKRCLAAFLDLVGLGVLPVEPHTAPEAERVEPPPELAFATWRPYLARWAAEAGFERVRALCRRGGLPPAGSR